MHLHVITRSTTCDANRRTRWSRPIVSLCPPSVGGHWPRGQDCRLGGERPSEANAGWLAGQAPQAPQAPGSPPSSTAEGPLVKFRNALASRPARRGVPGQPQARRPRARAIQVLAIPALPPAVRPLTSLRLEEAVPCTGKAPSIRQELSPPSRPAPAHARTWQSLAAASRFVLEHPIRRASRSTNAHTHTRAPTLASLPIAFAHPLLRSRSEPVRQPVSCWEVHAVAVVSPLQPSNSSVHLAITSHLGIHEAELATATQRIRCLRQARRTALISRSCNLFSLLSPRVHIFFFLENRAPVPRGLDIVALPPAAPGLRVATTSHAHPLTASLTSRAAEANYRRLE